jgi:integrase
MGAWHRKPRTRRDGTVSYSVGYTDEQGVERTRGGFTRKTKRSGPGSAEAFIEDYRAAAHSGLSSLKAFLDVEVRGIRPVETPERELTVDEVTLLWWALDADPDLPGGLSPATFLSYQQVHNKHIRPRVGPRPISDMARAAGPLALRTPMRAEGVGEPTVKRAIAALSSMLSWAVDHGHLEANGAKLISGTRRRSQRGPTATPGSAARARGATRPPGWALDAGQVAAVLRAMESADGARTALRLLRDSTAAMLQFLTGCRDQDVWGVRWHEVGPDDIHFAEVVSYGELSAGKVQASDRYTPIPPLLVERLAAWRAALAEAGRPCGMHDFVFPGSARDGHFTANQAKKWGPRYFQPAVTAARAAEGLDMAGATPYALRRGHISLRLRAGADLKSVAKQCGTSTEMLHRHYWTDLTWRGPVDTRPLGEQLADALGQLPGRHLRAV